MTKKTCLFILAGLFLQTAVFAEGFLYLPENGGGQSIPDIVLHHVQVSIGTDAVVTSVEQHFQSGSSHVPSASYMFPVPKGRQVVGFHAMIDGKEVPSEYMDELKTREFCERKVRSSRDPSALVYSRGAFYRFTVPAFSLREKKMITLLFSETPDPEKKPYSYLYPLGGLSYNAPHDVRICVTAGKDFHAGALRSLTYPVVLSEGGNSVTAVYEGKSIPGVDFRLIAGNGESPLFSAYREDGMAGYFMFSANPLSGSRTIDRDIVYLVDTSGSMAGKKLNGAVRSIVRSIHELGERDRFQVIGFGDGALTLFKSLSNADSVNRAAAEIFLNKIRTGGGTNYDEALKSALDIPNDPSRPFHIVIVTDGRPSAGEAGEELLIGQIRKKIKPNIRFFILGLGHELNSRFFDRLASLSNGEVRYADSDKDTESALDSLCAACQKPVLTEITAIVKGVKASVLPAQIPDLSAGSAVTLFGRFDGDGAGTLVLQGKVSGRSRTFVYPLSFPVTCGEQPAIPLIWHARSEGDILRRVRIRGESADAAAEMAASARASGIFAPSARFCISEDEARKNPPAVAVLNASSQMKSSWKKEASAVRSVFGEAGVRGSASASRFAAAENLMIAGVPDTDTPKIRVAGGRALYASKGGWIDSALPPAKDIQTRKVIFASDEYFDLLNQEPGIEALLAVGRQIRFMYRGRVFEITP